MATYSPYQAPGSAYAQEAMPMTSGEPITPLMIEHFRGAKPWIRFLSIMGFLGAGLMLLSSMIMFAAGAMMDTAATRGGMPVFSPGPWLGLIYLPLSLFYLVPAIYMHRFANAIGDLVINPGARAMEAALERHKAFWKLVGIATLVMIGLTIIFVVVAAVAGVMAAASMGRP